MVIPPIKLWMRLYAHIPDVETPIAWMEISYHPTPWNGGFTKPECSI